MLSRGRSHERGRKVTPPQPSYMSNDQFSDYLANLRNNRVQRPSGARPLPSSNRRESDRLPLGSNGRASTTNAGAETCDEPQRPSSPAKLNASVSSRHSKPSFYQTPVAAPLVKPSEVVPSATYIERGSRWMEKEEAVSLREALEDMDLKVDEEETRIFSAAQTEASELVWQHQNPKAAKLPGAPYSYKEHLRKNSYAHARTQSVGRFGGLGLATGLARDITPRSVSGGSNTTASVDIPTTTQAIVPTPPIAGVSPTSLTSASSARGMQYLRDQTQITVLKKRGEGQRRVSGKRNISGEVKTIFTGDQIWEETEQAAESVAASKAGTDAHAPLALKSKNPLSRVHFATESLETSKSSSADSKPRFSRFNIHRNPPSQSRNAAYTTTPPQVIQGDTSGNKSTDGPEVRSPEIKQATSMLLKDRSPKLPTPTAVSDRPGRPIVSFESNWKPKEADEHSEERRLPWLRGRTHAQRQSLPARSDSLPISSAEPTSTALNARRPAPFADIPKILLPGVESHRNHGHGRSIGVDLPAELKSQGITEIPVISVSATGSTRDTDSTCVRPAPVPAIVMPTIVLPGEPQSAPAVPAINVSRAEPEPGKRALPVPSQANRPPPRKYMTLATSHGHWSAYGASKITVSCHQCQLPIQGRVVALKGVTERFHPECFICFCCGTALEALEISPEPEAKRNERIDRIRRREHGEVLEEIDGQTVAEDGDERLRFYCHLDWHENYAPRCKHCTTPIIGEHAVALGEHWHYGHFFCAECGTPFEHGMTHIEKDGYAWCLSCQTQRTERRAPKCKKCRKAVIGQYVEALGGEWHDECFRCHTCKGGFDDGQIFPKEDVDGQTAVLCTACRERELKA